MASERGSEATPTPKPWDARPRIGPHKDILDVRPEDRNPGDPDFPYLEDDLVLLNGHVCLLRGSYPVFGKIVHAISDVMNPMDNRSVSSKKLTYVGRWDGRTPLMRLQHLATRIRHRPS